MTYLILDFETRSTVNLWRAGAWRYAEDPSTEIMCLAFKIMGAENIELWEPLRLGSPVPEALHYAASDPNITFLAHNAQFEQAIWYHLMHRRFGLPELPVERWDDTMAWALHKGLPGKLEKVAPVLNIALKDMEGNRLLQRLSKPRKARKGEDKNATHWDEDPEKLGRLGEYCIQDVKVEEELARYIGPLPPEEREIWLLDQKINNRGVRLDIPSIKAARELMRKYKKSVHDALDYLTLGDIQTTNQTEKMSKWVKDQCGKAPSNWKAETVDKALASESLKKNYPDVYRMFELRKAGSKSSTSKLDAMLACVCADGRARGLLQYQGAATTGRWAGRLIQPQNLTRGELGLSEEELLEAIYSGDPEWVALAYGDPAQVVSDALRPMIIAEDGYEIIRGDFKAIEARIVLALAEQWDKVRLLKEGRDVYSDMATEIFGYKVNGDDHPKERQVGKNAVLGLGFQCGGPTFQEKFCKDRDLGFCYEVVQTYRKSWAPNVPELWEGFENAAVRACHYDEKVTHAGIVFEMEREWLTARLPSGRKLYWHGAFTELRPAPWDEDDKRLQVSYFAFKYGQWRQVDSYGGHFTENIVQAIARDMMAEAMKAVEKQAPVILTVHDENVSEVLKGVMTPDEYGQIMVDAQPRWVAQWGIPVAVETMVGERYGK